MLHHPWLSARNEAMTQTKLQEVQEMRDTTYLITAKQLL